MYRSRGIAVGALVVGSLSLGTIGAAPAVADAGSYARPASGQFGVLSSTAANAVSQHFAGWVFAKTGSTSVTSVFRMPATIACTPTTSGINAGVSPGSFMITGTTAAKHFNGAGVLIFCRNGRAGAAANTIIDLNEKFDTTHSLSGGDMIKSTVTTNTFTTTATVTDLTKNFTFTNSGAGHPALQEMIEDDSVVTSNPAGQQYPVANFGQIPFSLGAVGDQPLGAVTPRRAFDMQTTAGVLQILTGPLTGTPLNAFNTFFKHS